MVLAGAGAVVVLDPKIVLALSCSDWQYCGIHGYPCASCSGGSDTQCPSGCRSQSSWTYCCTDGSTGCSYYITYTDCCGCSPSCGTFCTNSNQAIRYTSEVTATDARRQSVLGCVEVQGA